jgi:eukaryotic-like serine/threonine-protein kinase
VLAVLTVVVTIAINMFGGNTRDVQVPDVRGQAWQDAVATLQNAGFKTREEQQPDSEIPPQHVINTEPGAGTLVGAGDEITVNISYGPEQREIPDVRNLTPEQARERLKDAGFENVREALSPSTPAQKGTVLQTNPQANQTTAITNLITIVVGSGPDSEVVPDCVGLTVDDCRTILNQSGFQNTAPVDVDSTRPAGQVIGTNPPATRNVPVDTVIQIQVSEGNQFIMPNLRGMFWTEAEPYLRSLGWTGGLIKLPNAQNSGVPSNGVVTQDPAAGTAINFGGSITLSFAQ